VEVAAEDDAEEDERAALDEEDDAAAGGELDEDEGARAAARSVSLAAVPNPSLTSFSHAAHTRTGSSKP